MQFEETHEKSCTFCGKKTHGKMAIVYGVWGKVAIVYCVWGKVAIVYGVKSYKFFELLIES